MSRTKRRGGASSPIKKYLSFSGSTGQFSYYDKEAKESVELDELSIIVLDVRGSVTGYNSANKAQISSNLVAEIGNDELVVQSWKDGKATQIAKGLYKDIKAQVKEAGGKFTTNIICLADVGDGEEMCNLQLTGSSLNGWIEFVSSLERDGEYDNRITITKGALSKVDGKKFVPVTEKEEKDLEAKLKKNPRTRQPIWFYVLAFDTTELTEDEVDTAVANDEKLQDYFSASSGEKTSNETSDDTPDVPEDEEEEGKDDLPF